MMRNNKYENYSFKVLKYYDKWIVFDEWKDRILATMDDCELANELAIVFARLENRKYALGKDRAA